MRDVDSILVVKFIVICQVDDRNSIFLLAHMGSFLILSDGDEVSSTNLVR